MRAARPSPRLPLRPPLQHARVVSPLASFFLEGESPTFRRSEGGETRREPPSGPSAGMKDEQGVIGGARGGEDRGHTFPGAFLSHDSHMSKSAYVCVPGLAALAFAPRPVLPCTATVGIIIDCLRAPPLDRAPPAPPCA